MRTTRTTPLLQITLAVDYHEINPLHSKTG